MPLTARFSVLAFTLLCLNSPGVFSENFLTPEDIEKFKFECSSNEQLDIEFGFAPVQKLSPEDQVKNRWRYAYQTSDKQYGMDKIVLPRYGGVQADVVMKLNYSDSEFGESYLWNVIVAPRLKRWKFGAHWPARSVITENPRLAHKRESLIQMATMSAINEQPVHSQISPKDIDSAGTLNSAWEDVFGKKIVSNLVYPASKDAQANHPGYSLTFYLVPTPSLRLINPDSYKWPSSKYIDREGSVFGFLLTPDGECIAWDSIQVSQH